MRSLTLKKLIIMIALLAFTLSVASNVVSTYRMNKEMLITNTLKNHQVYAQKLAVTTDMYMEELLQTLTYSASLIGKDITNKQMLQLQTSQLQQQENAFNSIVVVDNQGKFIANAPESVNLIGESIKSPALIDGFKSQKPFITKPFFSTTKRLVIVLTSPIFDEAGKFVGMLGGTIYLNQHNLFDILLEEHYYEDGSYVYVVDRDGYIVYHPDNSRVGELIRENVVVKKAIAGNSGFQKVMNLRNVEMLSGYAYAPVTQLGIVSQRPVDITLKPSYEMAKKVIIDTIPSFIISFILIFFGASKISKPLQQLAEYVSQSSEKNEEASIEKVNGWYYEAIELKQAALQSFSTLHDKVTYLKDQTNVDDLTGLFNRRSMDHYLDNWIEKNIPFCMVMLDIDHFKAVNDTYGHIVGDEVIKFLAQQMKMIVRESDVCCRYGGEEFVILFPNTSIEVAYGIAERLRSSIESTIAPHGEKITISAGLVESNETSSAANNLVHVADIRLYEAKKNGRNQIVIANKLHVKKL